MVVKKKPVSSELLCDSIDLSEELLRVRGAITQLQPGDTTMANETASTPGNSTPKTNKKTPTKKTPTKKKPPTGENLVSLSDVCKELKLQPRAARRILRDSKLKHNGRWAWEKNSSDLTKVKSTLKA